MPKKAKRAPASSKRTKTASKKAMSARPKAASRPRPKTKKDGFLAALAALLRRRGMAVPSGLLKAPAEAYAAQTAEFVATLAKLDDPELAAHAERVAGYARRQAERARLNWETSPLIGEIRRRKLKEPPRPERPVAVAFSLKRPLAEWSDKELLAAAAEWSKRGR